MTVMRRNMLILSAIVGFPAWIWLFMLDWKIALALLVIMFSNNIAQKLNNE